MQTESEDLKATLDVVRTVKQNHKLRHIFALSLYFGASNLEID